MVFMNIWNVDIEKGKGTSVWGESSNTVKPVCNYHLYNKMYHL